MTAPLLAAEARIAWLEREIARDLDCAHSFARHANTVYAEAAAKIAERERLLADLAERAAMNRDRREVSALAGIRVRIKE